MARCHIENGPGGLIGPPWVYGDLVGTAEVLLLLKVPLDSQPGKSGEIALCCMPCRYCNRGLHKSMPGCLISRARHKAGFMRRAFGFVWILGTSAGKPTTLHYCRRPRPRAGPPCAEVVAPAEARSASAHAAHERRACALGSATYPPVRPGRSGGKAASGYTRGGPAMPHQIQGKQ